jgi:hypothetical protein
MTSDFEFLLHMQRLMFEAEALAKQYEVEDRFISIMFAGLINPMPGDMSKLSAMYSINVEDFSELIEIQEFIIGHYNEEAKQELDDDELNDLLNGLDVDLE